MTERKRIPWNKRSKITSGGDRLKDWKDDGSIVVFVHTKSGITPRLFHLVPYVDLDDKNKKVVRYLPFVCHEDPQAYYNRVPPQSCPIDRLIELLASDGRIDDDEVVWDATIGNKLKDRIVTKGDFCGTSQEWKNSFKPRGQYVMAVVDVEEPEKGLQIAVESVSLGDSLIQCVQQEMDSNGDDMGDPDANPYAFKFTYDKNAGKPGDYYSAYAYRRAELTPEIKALLDGDPVDISRYIAPGNSSDLRKIMEAHLKVDVDLDIVFDAVLDPESTESNKRPSKSKDSSNEPEEEKKPAPKPAKKKPEPEPEPEPDPEPEPEPEENGEECETCDGTGKVGKKGSPCPDCDGTGRIASEPGEETADDSNEATGEEEEEFICETCDGTGKVGKKGRPCPDCDGKGTVTTPPKDEDEDPEPEPEPEPEPKPKKPTNRTVKQPKQTEMEQCGGCKKMIPAGVEVCPYCGAEFGD